MRKNFWISLFVLLLFAVPAHAKRITFVAPPYVKSTVVIESYDAKRSSAEVVDYNGCPTLVIIKAKRERVKRHTWTPWDNQPRIQPSRPVQPRVVTPPTANPVIINNPYVR